VNPEQRKRVIVMAVLGVVLVGVVIWQLMPREGATAPDTGPAPDSSQGEASKTGAEKAAATPGFKTADADIDALVASVEVLDFNYWQERIHRDPMTPLRRGNGVGNSNGKGEVYIAIRDKVVSGIVWDARNPCAVVDDEIVFRGSTFPLGIVVVDIGQDYVTFRGGDVELSVGLKE